MAKSKIFEHRGASFYFHFPVVFADSQNRVFISKIVNYKSASTEPDYVTRLKNDF